ncbi:hypothetical protein INT47_002808 [Mucor saturninus]|uniref:Enoyl reductase (ER) domain-containing protein n=1 Tax=Mucor saturninus TaxID=64648 RepID=A0A8H7QXT3_9FUNG|nr:hypothetical protein INT47_002808 [Mucor saturninus]
MAKVPETMHSIQLVKFGPPKEAMFFNEQTPVPQIKTDSQVLVRIKAAGINPIDAKLASGNLKIGTRFMTLPTIPGADFSGVIVAKGAKVDGFEIGDHVFGSKPVLFGGEGVFAQYGVIDTKVAAIAKKPDHLSFEQAASAGIPVITAYDGIIKNGHINENNKQKKRNILIIGASGGVGSYGVQLAKAINQENTVIGICSEKNIAFVKSLGADRVIDYKNKDAYKSFINEKIPFDIIFDCVGGDEYYSQLDPLLVEHGVYSTAVGPVEYAGSSQVNISTVATVLKSVLYKKLFSAHSYIVVTALSLTDFKLKVVPFFDDNQIKGTVWSEENIFPLKDVCIAFEKISSHRTVGKIVLSIA